MSRSSKKALPIEPTVYLCTWDTRETVPPGSKYGPVVRNVYTIECNVSGYGTVTINEQTFVIKPGDCYFLLPGQTVTFTADTKDPRLALYCTAGGLRLGQILEKAGISGTAPFAPPESFDGILAIMKRLHDIKENDLGSDLRRTACLYDLMAVLTQGRNDTNADHFTDRAIGLMETAYHTGISVADIAAQMGFDRC